METSLIGLEMRSRLIVARAKLPKRRPKNSTKDGHIRDGRCHCCCENCVNTRYNPLQERMMLQCICPDETDLDCPKIGRIEFQGSTFERAQRKLALESGYLIGPEPHGDLKWTRKPATKAGHPTGKRRHRYATGSVFFASILWYFGWFIFDFRAGNYAWAAYEAFAVGFLIPFIPIYLSYARRR